MTEILPIEVTVSNWPPHQEKPRYRLTTTPRTVVIDAAGVSGPTSMDLFPYDPSREYVDFQTIDGAVLVTNDPPNVAPPITSSAANPPPGGSIHVINNAAYHLRMWGPDPLWLISITGQVATRVTMAITRRVCE